MIDPMSYYLAKLIGLSLFIVGFAMLTRLEYFRKTAADISKSDAVMTLISIIPLVVGLALVLAHNRWDPNWTVVITLVGWFILIVGLFRLFFHKFVMHVIGTASAQGKRFIVAGIINIIVGAYLAYMGFYA